MFSTLHWMNWSCFWHRYHYHLPTQYSISLFFCQDRTGMSFSWILSEVIFRFRRFSFVHYWFVPVLSIHKTFTIPFLHSLAFFWSVLFCIEFYWPISIYFPNAFPFLLAISVFISESVQNVTCQDQGWKKPGFFLKIPAQWVFFFFLKKILFLCISFALLPLLASPIIFFLKIKRTHLL